MGTHAALFPSTVSTYLLIDGRQQGPYSPDQLQALLSSSAIRRDCLAWRVGLPEWRPLNSVLVTWQESKAKASGKPAGTIIGVIGLIIGALGIVAWPCLLVVGSLLESEPMLAVFGLTILAGMSLNCLGTVLGGIGLFSSKASKVVAIIAIALNLLPLLGMVFLIALGLTIQEPEPMP